MIFNGKYYGKDEESVIVQGQHEPIIPETPLRGFLLCPNCGRMLTGSASKGRHNHYYYYHCISSCGCRFKAENANGLFVRELKKYVPHPGMNEIYVAAIHEAYSHQTKHVKSGRIQILSQLDELNTRLKNAREMVADQKLDPDDFRELKAECTTKINELEAKLTGFSQKESNIDGLLNKAVSNLSALDMLYEEGAITEKRRSSVRYSLKN